MGGTVHGRHLAPIAFSPRSPLSLTLYWLAVEAEKFRISPSPTALLPLLQRVVQGMQPWAKKEGITLTLELGQGLEVPVVTSRQRQLSSGTNRSATSRERTASLTSPRSTSLSTSSSGASDVSTAATCACQAQPWHSCALLHWDGPRIQQVLQGLISNAIKSYLVPRPQRALSTSAAAPQSSPVSGLEAVSGVASVLRQRSDSRSSSSSGSSTSIGSGIASSSMSVHLRATAIMGFEGFPQGVKLEVADNGCGIDEEGQARLFRPFSQAHETDSRSGTGLGLVIAKELISQHGGRISLTSAVGVGTTFTIVLPVAAPGVIAEQASQAIAIAPAASSSEHTSCAAVSNSNSSSSGGSARGPPGAVTMHHHKQQKLQQHPDVPLLDVHRAAASLRVFTTCDPYAAPPVSYTSDVTLGVSPPLARSHSSHDNHSRSSASGLESRDPSSAAGLTSRRGSTVSVAASDAASSIAVVSPTASMSSSAGRGVRTERQPIMPTASAAAASAASSVCPAPAVSISRPLRILVVDDISLNRRLLIRTLGNKLAGATFTEVADGAQALGAVEAAAAAGVPPDVVLMDRNMPVMVSECSSQQRLCHAYCDGYPLFFVSSNDISLTRCYCHSS